MLAIRKAAERGQADHGWLRSQHTFSFGSYQDPSQMGFGSLRVINEDRVAAGQGFGTHPHRDMEIVSYVLSGELEHRDSMGHGEVLTAGEFQRISAGTGITHSEFNPSPTNPVHFYQIWLLPRQRGLAPSYEQRRFDVEGRLDQWQMVASPDGVNDSLTIQQDAKIMLGDLTKGKKLTYHLETDRQAWVQVLKGSLELNSQSLSAGDGVAVSEISDLDFLTHDSAEIMLFDLGTS